MNMRIFVASILFSVNALMIAPVFATKQNLSALILTPHYGILTYRDLEMYAINRIIPIEPFDPNEFTGREHWQCFDSKDIAVNYHSWVNDDVTGEKYCDMHVVITKNAEKIHDYGLRRAQPVEYCKEKNALWNKIIKNQPYTCLGGIYVGEDKLLPGATVKVKGWVFDKIKTKKDYDSFFDEPEDS